MKSLDKLIKDLIHKYPGSPCLLIKNITLLGNKAYKEYRRFDFLIIIHDIHVLGWFRKNQLYLTSLTAAFPDEKYPNWYCFEYDVDKDIESVLESLLATRPIYSLNRAMAWRCIDSYMRVLESME